ncbi:FMN-binding protein [uncultured Alcanivorax sp.]|uniref:FMN-binding protein n=1 Tax=uncultured Alcanivorax sp. TaxID=191215 RepID=UPI00262A0A9B|nr:FMN-binding protein [uncultured Alcanivorax sp.]
MPRVIALLLMLGLAATLPAYEVQIRHLSQRDFLQQVFADQEPQAGLLPLRGELRERVTTVLGHPYRGLRLRYWHTDTTSAWIIDEKSKDMPMTVGVAVGPEGIVDLEILVYREPRGGEVHQAFFRRQYRGMTLSENDTLSGQVDGITGATLSVDATSRVAAMALVLHQAVMENNGNVLN